MKTQLAKMLTIAATAHENQFDKAGEPYLLHCLNVMLLLGEVNEEDLQCIALGHDLFEDTKITASFLKEKGFSERVIRGIQAMTKQRGQDYEEYKLQIKRNKDATKVKLADLTHNSDIRRIKEPGEKDFERTKRYRQFYTELLEIAE